MVQYDNACSPGSNKVIASFGRFVRDGALRVLPGTIRQVGEHMLFRATC